jgi:hypothetical protein
MSSKDLTEENILTGVINNNISYFIENYEIAKDNIFFMNYFKEYINGELVEVDNVLDNIINNFDIKVIEICYRYLEESNFHTFIDSLTTIIINPNNNFNNYTEMLSILDKLINNIDVFDVYLNIDIADILDFIVNNNNINKSNSPSFKLFFKLLKHKDMRPKIIEYFDNKVEYYKQNRELKNVLTIDEEYVSTYNQELIFNTNLYIILIELWAKGINKYKLSKINSETTNFLSVSFFQIHKLLEYILANNYNEKDLRIKELDHIKKLLVNNNNNAGLKSIKINVEKILNILYSIIKNKTMLVIIDNFYENTIYWINNNLLQTEESNVPDTIPPPHRFKTIGGNLCSNAKHVPIVLNECNDILETLYVFCKNYRIELCSSFTEFIINIFNEKLTSNPHTKINYMKLFNNSLLDIVEHNKKTIAIPDFVNYDKNISKITLSLLTLYSGIKKSFNNDEIYNILYPMSILSTIFNLTIYTLEDYRYYFNTNVNINSKYFKELMYDNLNNFQFIIDEILCGLNKISEIETSSATISNENHRIIDEEKKKINNLNIYFNIFSTFIIKSSKYYSEIILCDEIKHGFNNILITTLNKLTSKNRKQYKIVDTTNLNFHPIDGLIIIKNILLNLITKRPNETILVTIISENDGYAKNSILLLINILSKKDKIKTMDYNYLNCLDNSINNKLEVIKALDIEIPDELCDPIMDTLIQNPIMLPNNIIIDYSTISRHLLTNETNPFNRTPLTHEILEDYNQLQDVKIKIDEFKLKLKEFNDKHKHNI